MIQRLEEKWLESRGIKAPDGMVLISAGSFTRGMHDKGSRYFENLTASSLPNLSWKNEPRYFSSPSYRRESPQTEVSMPTSFWMDRNEFTNRQFLAYLIETKQKNDSATRWVGWKFLPYTWTDSLAYPKGQDEFPAVLGISLYSARKMAKHLGKEVPTEEQFEKAARGFTSGRIWPWGNKQDTSYGA